MRFFTGEETWWDESWMLGTTDGPDQAAHPAPQSWQSWGGTAKTLSCYYQLVITFFFSFLYFSTWASDTLAKQTHQWWSRRDGLANGSEPEVLRGRAASVMMRGRWMVNCKSWFFLYYFVGHCQLSSNEEGQTGAALMPGNCSHLINKSLWEISHTFVRKCIIQL